MKDLTLGDAHIVPLDDLISRADGHDLVSDIPLYLPPLVMLVVCVNSWLWWWPKTETEMAICPASSSLL